MAHVLLCLAHVTQRDVLLVTQVVTGHHLLMLNSVPSWACATFPSSLHPSWLLKLVLSLAPWLVSTSGRAQGPAVQHPLWAGVSSPPTSGPGPHCLLVALVLAVVLGGAQVPGWVPAPSLRSLLCRSSGCTSWEAELLPPTLHLPSAPCCSLAVCPCQSSLVTSWR